jgi:prolyl-tRNA editing enzyme YbaK/EbsC (Cys-tRNA(Pro) deacylase)
LTAFLSDGKFLIMADTLSGSAQRVQDALAACGVSCSVIEMPATTRTAKEAAAAIGCTVAQIAKSIIFRTSKGGTPILVIASGVNRVNERRVREIIGETIQIADAEYVREVTGFVIGGVPPVGHATAIRTILDADLMNFGVIWAAAGTPRAVFQLTPQDLKKITAGIFERIT